MLGARVGSEDHNDGADHPWDLGLLFPPDPWYFSGFKWLHSCQLIDF